MSDNFYAKRLTAEMHKDVLSAMPSELSFRTRRRDALAVAASDGNLLPGVSLKCLPLVLSFRQRVRAHDPSVPVDERAVVEELALVAPLSSAQNHSIVAGRRPQRPISRAEPSAQSDLRRRACNRCGCLPLEGVQSDTARRRMMHHTGNDSPTMKINKDPRDIQPHPQGAHVIKPVSCFALALILLTFTSCGGSSTTPTAPTAPTAAVFNVTETPNPIIAGAGSSGFQFSGAFNLTVTESAGLGGNVNFVNVTLRNATTGLELNTINFGATDVFNRAGTNHVAARGTLNIPLSVVYTLALGGRQATMTIAVQIGDDAGHIFNQSLTVPIV